MCGLSGGRGHRAARPVSLKMDKGDLKRNRPGLGKAANAEVQCAGTESGPEPGPEPGPERGHGQRRWGHVDSACHGRAAAPGRPLPDLEGRSSSFLFGKCVLTRRKNTKLNVNT